jgi:hypothetical protein
MTLKLAVLSFKTLQKGKVILVWACVCLVVVGEEGVLMEEKN